MLTSYYDRFLYRRALCSLLLGTMLVLGLIACRGGTEKEADADSVVARATVIRFADEAFKEGLYAPLMDAYAEANPDFRIEYVPVEDAVDKRTGEMDLFQLASMADVMVLPRTPGNGESSYFLDISSMLDDRGLSATDYWPESLAGCGADETAAALPLYVVPSVLYVNGALLSEADLMPAPGWSWKDFADLVQATGDRGDAYGFVEIGGPGELFAPTIAKLLPEGDAELDVAALSQATGWYVDLVSEELIFVASADATAEGLALIDEGQAAMWLESPAQLAGRRSDLGEAVSVVPYPVGESDTQTTPVSIACIALSAGTSQPEAAWAWLNFLSEHPFVARRWEIPGKIAVADDSGFWDSVDEETEAAYRYALDHAWYGLRSAGIDMVAGALTDAIIGQTDSESALAAIGELPTPTPAPTPAEVPVVVSGQTAIQPGTEGILRFFASGSTINMNSMRQAAEGFSERSGMFMEFGDFYTISLVPGAEGTDSLFAIIASEFDCFAWVGQLPDVLVGQVLPLDELITGQNPELLADYAPHTLEQARRDDGLYGVPLALHPQAFFYNADRFERRGIPTPDMDWTVDDFVEIAGQMPLGEGDSRIYGFVPYPGNLDISPYALLLDAYGAPPLDWEANPPAVNFAAAETVAAVNWLAGLVEAGIIAPYEPASSDGTGNVRTIDATIDSGRATIWNESVGLAENRFGWQTANFILGAAVPPGQTQSLPAPLMTRLYITAQSENVSQCLDWFDILSNDQDVMTGIPARTSLRDSLAWEQEVGPERADLYRELVARATAQPSEPALVGPLVYWLDTALADVFAGVDTEQALVSAQENADAFLACTTNLGESTQEQILGCAQQIDPDFPTHEEE